MPLIRTNGPSSSSSSSSHYRRTLSSRSLATPNGKISLSSSSLRIQSHPKLSALGKKRNTEIEFSSTATSIGGRLPYTAGVGEKDSNTADVDIDMTFLQYCTTCDKQILVPNSQVLYCSESCRRKDSLSTTPPADLKLASRSSVHLFSPSASPFSKMGFEANPFHVTPSQEEQSKLLPHIGPTSLPIISSKPPELHSFKQDLDPTEWKPNSTKVKASSNPVSAVPFSLVIPSIIPEGRHDVDGGDEEESGDSETTGQTSSKTRPGNPRHQSAAFGYLAQFHRSASSFVSLATKRPSLKSRESSISVSNQVALGRTSRPETPAMSLGRSSGSSAASSTSSIVLCTPGHNSTVPSIVASHALADSATEQAPTKDGERLAFGKQTMTTAVEAVGMTVPGNAEGSLGGLLAKAA